MEVLIELMDTTMLIPYPSRVPNRT